MLEGMDFTGESLHEKYTEVVGQPLNENTLKIPSSVGYFPQDIGIANLLRREIPMAWGTTTDS